MSASTRGQNTYLDGVARLICERPAEDEVTLVSSEPGLGTHFMSMLMNHSTVPGVRDYIRRWSNGGASIAYDKAVKYAIDSRQIHFREAFEIVLVTEDSILINADLDSQLDRAASIGIKVSVSQYVPRERSGRLITRDQQRRLNVKYHMASDGKELVRQLLTGESTTTKSTELKSIEDRLTDIVSAVESLRTELRSL